MALTVTCAGCGKSFRVKDDYAGRKGKCPYCQAMVAVPSAESRGESAQLDLGSKPEPQPASVARAPASKVNVPPPQAVQASPVPKAVPAQAGPAPQPTPTAVALEQQILGAFQGEIARVRVSIVYRFGILLVALLMVLLPLAYVGLIGLVGYGMYWHAVNDLGLFRVVRGRALIIALAVYVAPLVAGVILLLFMVKPFFAPPATERRTRSLTRKSDPLLFAFVDRVCATVRAPRPRRIDVDCEVNASAGFRRGLWSMFGSDLVLTIGLPLAGGLTLRQFAGVLAHEFGHFTQGTGMRLTYLIRRISGWLTRVVYERDAWDEMLVRSCEDADWRIALILQFARLMVWLTQKVLWVLMIVGHAVAGFMLRQMEFDADRHETRLAGSEAFESTVRRLMLLNAAHQRAQADLWQSSQEGRLPDNLPRLLLANVKQIPADARTQLDQMNVTWDVYCGVFGPQFKSSSMHPIDDLLARQDKEADADRALGRCFQGTFSPLRPLPLAPLSSDATPDPQACAGRVRAGRQRMLDLKPAYRKTLAEFEKAHREMIEADQATALSKADLKIRPNDFSTDLTTATAASSARRKAEERKEQVAAGLVEFEKAAGDRLSAALELLQVPQIAGRLESAKDWRKERDRIVPAVRAIAAELPGMMTLRNEHAALGILLDRLEGNQRNEQYLITVQRASEAVQVSISQRRNQLNIVAYPLEHAKASTTVGDYMVANVPSPEDVVEVYHAGQAAVDNVLTLYARLVARLTLLAEQIEKTLGLQPLPEPTGEEKPPASA